MVYDISANDAQEIDFAPQSIEREVVQNVRTILSTQAGTVPIDRDFGISWGPVDQPMNRVSAAMNAEVIRKIRKYEPRARVLRVYVTDADPANGTVVPRVKIEVR